MLAPDHDDSSFRGGHDGSDGDLRVEIEDEAADVADQSCGIPVLSVFATAARRRTLDSSGTRVHRRVGVPEAFPRYRIILPIDQTPMSILKVARMGHPILRALARMLERSEIARPPIQQLIDDMIETMHEYHGIGLAAPQVHEALHLFVAAIDPDKEDDPGPEDAEDAEPIVLINPVVMPVGSAVVEDWEGCLSIPDVRGLVPRAREIIVTAMDRTGSRVETHASGASGRGDSTRNGSPERRAVPGPHEGPRLAHVPRRIHEVLAEDEGGLTSSRRRSANLRRPLGLEPLQLHVGAVRKTHRVRYQPMAGLFRDEPVHGLADPPVRRVALGRRPQLDEVHGLAGVEIHVEADAIRHRQGVRRDIAESLGVEAVQVGGCVHDPPPVVVRPRELDRLRLDVPVSRCERSPLERQQAMSLEVAERAVVRKDIETIGRSLERPSGLVPAVLPCADVGSQDFGPLDPASSGGRWRRADCRAGRKPRTEPPPRL